jgi:hypothetical protein
MRTSGYQVLIPALPTVLETLDLGNGKTLDPRQSGESSGAKAEDGRECARSCHGAQIRSSASSGRF